MPQAAIRSQPRPFLAPRRNRRRRHPLAWQALHLALRDDAGRLAGLLPLYLREHSFGDFSRDWNWAPAWRQTGREYSRSSSAASIHAFAGSAPAGVRRRMRRCPALIDAARRLAGELRASSGIASSCGSRQAPAGSRRIAHAARRAVSLAQPRGYRDFRRLPAGVQRGEAKKTQARAGAPLPRVRAAHRGPPRRRDRRARGGPSTATTATPSALQQPSVIQLEFFRRVGVELGRRMVVFIAWREAQPVASAILYRDDAARSTDATGAQTSPSGAALELCYYRGHRIRHPPRPAALRGQVRRASTSWRAASGR
ncbi:MAG: GNAT family N-acetyltransferase [Rhodocyclaceae bacterium]|nr:GNAT family N-acetyltransferase [Rhodocyclaceae bacterium]